MVNDPCFPLSEDLQNWLVGSDYFSDETMTDIETYSPKNNIRISAREENNIYESGGDVTNDAWVR